MCDLYANILIALLNINVQIEDGSSIRIDIPATYDKIIKFDIKITELGGNALISTGMDAFSLHTLTINRDGTYSTKE